MRQLLYMTMESSFYIITYYVKSVRIFKIHQTDRRGKTEVTVECKTTLFKSSTMKESLLEKTWTDVEKIVEEIWILL